MIAEEKVSPSNIMKKAVNDKIFFRMKLPPQLPSHFEFNLSQLVLIHQPGLLPERAIYSTVGGYCV
jgi:hypothetical protein